MQSVEIDTIQHYMEHYNCNEMRDIIVFYMQRPIAICRSHHMWLK